MNNRSFTRNGNTYIRVSKTRALTLWKKDIPVYIDSYSIYPCNSWGTTDIIPDQNTLLNADMTFNTYVRNFEWYNCDYERGYYAVFYVEDKFI